LPIGDNFTALASRSFTAESRSQSALLQTRAAEGSAVDIFKSGARICYRPDAPTMPRLRSVLILLIVLTFGVAYRPVGAGRPAA